MIFSTAIATKSLQEAIELSHIYRPYSEQPFNWNWADKIISTWPDGRAYLYVDGAYRVIPESLFELDFFGRKICQDILVKP